MVVWCWCCTKRECSVEEGEEERKCGGEDGGEGKIKKGMPAWSYDVDVFILEILGLASYSSPLAYVSVGAWLRGKFWGCKYSKQTVTVQSHQVS